ncbi:MULTISPECIES: RDD family protein [unclassified Candidatus Cardinium]|uniref:RDD family protein n=1 Tax=unclassified Candidatus Cardinium TaxID=2641185 RepID=UPI001FB494F3|nr:MULTISPECIES: RDD family protein [unclassified Candidatus Cardinium]
MTNIHWIQPKEISFFHAFKRWTARGFDACVGACILFLIGEYVLFSEHIVQIISNAKLNTLNGVINKLILLFLSGVINALLIAYFGNTLGKHLFGIKILDLKACHLSLQQAFKREMLVLIINNSLKII